MAETTYSYTISTDFPSGKVAPSALFAEIQVSAIVTAMERIDTTGDTCDVVFKDALSAGDKTILDNDTTGPSGGLIGAHTGVPLEGPTTVDGIPLVTFPQRSADDVPFVAQQQLVLGQEEFLRTDDGTALMNIDGTSSGTPVVLWNGTGGSDTGADWTASGTGSETVGSMHAGTNGWDTGVAALNDSTVFDNGSLVDVVGTYETLTFWLQPKAFPATSRLAVDFLDASNSQVGNQIRVEQSVTNMDLDVWQQVSLSISDFNLTADVQKLRFRYRTAAGQQHFLDDIELVPGGGGPYRFRVEAPDALTRYHVSMLVLVVAAPSAGWNPTAFADIAGGLSTGLLLRQRRKSDSEVLWKLNSKDNVDLFGRFHPQDDITFANGDLLVGFMVKPGKAAVVVTDDEVLEVVVRDDLSGLSSMRGYVHYGKEVIAP